MVQLSGWEAVVLTDRNHTRALLGVSLPVSRQRHAELPTSLLPPRHHGPHTQLPYYYHFHFLTLLALCSPHADRFNITLDLKAQSMAPGADRYERVGAARDPPPLHSSPALP